MLGGEEDAKCVQVAEVADTDELHEAAEVAELEHVQHQGLRTWPHGLFEEPRCQEAKGGPWL